jgi:hypothetical protein
MLPPVHLNMSLTVSYIDNDYIVSKGIVVVVVW